MPRLNFTLKDGTAVSVDCTVGDTVMNIATLNGLPGVEAVCGGFCSCATCHVYVDDAWIARLPPPSPDENEMLDGTAADRLPGSRLSCQIKITADLDGLSVRMPETQA
jgi:ferredoxin, 2Fe-2S